MTGIYLLTSPSGKQYVGQSNNLERRFNDYKSLNCKNQKALYRSFLKYGVDTFEFDILEICNTEDLNERECYYINKLNTISPNGYNLTSGGGANGIYSYESKMAITKGRCKNIDEYSDLGHCVAFNEHNEIIGCGTIFEIRKQLDINIFQLLYQTKAEDYNPHFNKDSIYFIENTEWAPTTEECEYMLT